MKKLHLIFAAVGLLVLSLSITGCDSNDPNNPQMPAIVSTSETNSDGIIVEVVYKNDLRMYFRLTSPNTCGLTTFAPFYGVRDDVISINDSVSKSNVSQGFEQYAYSGDLIIPETITHKGVVYTVTDIYGDVPAFSPDVTSVWIPKTIVEDIIWVMQGWRELSTINVSPDNPVYLSQDGILFNKDKTKLLCYTRNKAGDLYSVPNGVTEISGSAFHHCNNLTSVTLPNSVTKIDNYAFTYNSTLSTINIPNSVTEIGEGAFSECSSILSVNIPEGVTVINKFLFFWCTSLNSLTIPSTVTLVDQKAFYACYSLTTLTCLATTPPATFSSIYSWEGTTFSQCHITTVKVPAGSVSAYRAAEQWRQFNIVAL